MGNSNVLKKKVFNKSVLIGLGYVVLLVIVLSVIITLFLENDRRDYMLDNYEKSVALTTYEGYDGLLKLSEVVDFLSKDLETIALEGIDYIESDVFNENSAFKLKEIKGGYYIVSRSVYEKNTLFIDILAVITSFGMLIMMSWYLIYANCFMYEKRRVKSYEEVK